MVDLGVFSLKYLNTRKIKTEESFTGAYVKELYDPEYVRTTNKWLCVILDDTYKKADLHKVMVTQCQHLKMTQRNDLLKLLQNFKELFDGKFGTWKIDLVDFELKEDAKPICLRPYPVPKVYEEIFKKEVEHLFPLEVPEVANDSEWGAPSFAQPKIKSNWVRYINDFRNLNKQLNKKPHPMPKINEILLELEGFEYAMSIDLKMEYYHIQLSKDASNLCKIILPWGKYRHKCLPMGVANLPNILQQKMNDICHEFEFIRAYIDELLVLTKGDWKYHVHKL